MRQHLPTENPIEQCIQEDDWEGARRLIEADLAKNPQDPHWLLTRLSLTCYEQFDYVRALEFSRQAYALQPNCPLVLWDYAGALEMLERFENAVDLYRRLVERGLNSIAYKPCGEGIVWAKGLLTDCRYRLSHCYQALGRQDAAWEEMKICLKNRKHSSASIYPFETIQEEWRRLKNLF